MFWFHAQLRETGLVFSNSRTALSPNESINWAVAVNLGLNSTNWFKSAPGKTRPPAQRSATIPRRMKATLSLIIQARWMTASLVPMATTPAGSLSARPRPSGWSHTACLVLPACFRRPRWSSYKRLKWEFTVFDKMRSENVSLAVVWECNRHHLKNSPHSSQQL